jgi:hypothetical protein
MNVLLDRPRKQWNALDWTFLAIVAILAACVFYAARFEHFSGIHNSPALHMGNAWIVVIAACGICIIAPLIALVMALVRRPVSYKTFLHLGISLVPLIAGVGACGVGGAGARQYSRRIRNVGRKKRECRSNSDMARQPETRRRHVNDRRCGLASRNSTARARAG